MDVIAKLAKFVFLKSLDFVGERLLVRHTEFSIIWCPVVFDIIMQIASSFVLQSVQEWEWWVCPAVFRRISERPSLSGTCCT